MDYEQHSGPGGGGGGGALQLQAGRRIALDGEADASGGAGGGREPGVDTRVTAGGGGAGGSILLQTAALQMASFPGRLSVAGGSGGEGAAASQGGRGGAGLLRIEVPEAPPQEVFAGKILPDPDELAELGAALEDVLSVVDWGAEDAGPGLVSGAQSCWLGVEGNYFVLQPLTDEPGELAWDLTVDVAGMGSQSYRGENELFESSLEETWGSDLGSAPLVVRFQGVRVVDDSKNPCELTLGGPTPDILPGTLTGWVRHPAELDDFFGDPALRPNRIRFCVLFDRGQPGAEMIEGVEELRLSVLPD